MDIDAFVGDGGGELGRWERVTGITRNWTRNRVGGIGFFGAGNLENGTNYTGMEIILNNLLQKVLEEWQGGWEGNRVRMCDNNGI